MATRIADMSPRKAAKVAGILYLLVTVFAVFSGIIRFTPLLSGDAAATPSVFMAGVGIVGELIFVTCFLLLAWALYVLFKPVNSNLALLIVLCVSVSVAIQCVNLIIYIASQNMLSGADYLTVFTVEQLHAQSLFFLDLQMDGVIVAQIFWGLWLLPLGYLVFKSGYVPRVFGVLLMIGCFGYLIDVFQYFLFPGYEIITYPGLAISTIAEISFPIWLLLKGVKTQQPGGSA